MKPTFSQFAAMTVSCPGFLRDKPVDKPGRYFAEAWRHSFCGVKTSEISVEVEGRLAAYYRARWEALLIDRNTLSNECSVMWKIREA